MVKQFRSMRALCGIGAALLGLMMNSPARAETVSLTIKPSATDARITHADWPHLILYDSSRSEGDILLWLPGTNERPLTGPMAFFRTALARGYRVIGLSYVDAPAVSQVCFGVVRDPDCAAKFRDKRVYGTNVTGLIGDEPQDAIVNRVTRLIRYLASADMGGHWGHYLGGDAPRWDLIAVAGHSQGGGMAAFIAKRQAVARVIMFSGGWDQASPGRVAGWYAGESATPASRWYGNYHRAEPNAGIIAETYDALGIPKDHQLAFDLSVPQNRDAHGQGMSNAAYRPAWIEMLGTGKSE